MTLRESQIHQALIKRLKELGGEHRRVTWQGRRGAPDLLYLLPLQAGFVEEKRPGEVPEPHQAREIAALRAAGLTVHVISTLEEIDSVFPPPTERR